MKSMGPWPHGVREPLPGEGRGTGSAHTTHPASPAPTAAWEGCQSTLQTYHPEVPWAHFTGEHPSIPVAATPKETRSLAQRVYLQRPFLIRLVAYSSSTDPAEN